MRIDRFTDGVVSIRDIPDDMGSKTALSILVEADGDVVLTMKNPNIEEILRRAKAEVGQEITMQFCTLAGGGHNYLITRQLRELAMLLAKETKSDF